MSRNGQENSQLFSLKGHNKHSKQYKTRDMTLCDYDIVSKEKMSKLSF